MSMDQSSGDDMHEDDMLAAEYALGLLSGDDLSHTLRRMREDSAFAARVTAWEGQFSEMAEALEPVAPAAQTKRALMARVHPDAPAHPVGNWYRIWERLWLWQVASGVSLVLLLVVFLNSGTAPPVPGPLYTAEIVSEAGDFRVVALVDMRRDQIVLTRTEGAAPAGRILQVWAHGPDAPAESVGLWPDGETVRLALPPRIAAVNGVLTIGVSEEPPGGSPTGSPSGRVFGTVDIPGVTPTF